MNHDVCSVLQRTDKYGSECVIHDKYDAVLVSDGCYSLQIGNITVGVTECLGIDCLGVGADGCLKSLQVIHLNYGVADALG